MESEILTLPKKTGLCGCGCGQRTTRAKGDSPATGYIAGEFHRFIHGHFHRWKRRFVSTWGQPGKMKCSRIVRRVLGAERLRDEVEQAAITAATEAHKRGLLMADIEAAVREAVSNPAIAATERRINESATLDLNGDDAARYREIRRRKLQEAAA